MEIMEHSGPSRPEAPAQGTQPKDGHPVVAKSAEEHRAHELTAWEQRMREMQERAKSVDWSKTDFRTMNPKDIGVCMGPPMTRAEFEAYRKRSGKPVRIIGGDSK